MHKPIAITSAFSKTGGPWSDEKDSLCKQGPPAANTDAHAHNDDGDRREENLPPGHVQGHLVRPDSDCTWLT